MREIARRVWTEQSAALGVLASVALLVFALARGAALTEVELLEIATPALVGLGARRRP